MIATNAFWGDKHSVEPSQELADYYLHLSHDDTSVFLHCQENKTIPPTQRFFCNNVEEKKNITIIEYVYSLLLCCDKILCT